jgi:hypothetical protein
MWSSRWKRIGRGNCSTRRKPAPVPLCLPQIPHDLTWDRTHAAEVESLWLTAHAMARPPTAQSALYIWGLRLNSFFWKSKAAHNNTMSSLKFENRTLAIYQKSYKTLLGSSSTEQLCCNHSCYILHPMTKTILGRACNTCAPVWVDILVYHSWRLLSSRTWCH